MTSPVVRHRVRTIRVQAGRRPDDWMLRQLPAQMTANREHDFLVRFVRLFQSLGDDLLLHADNVEHLADRTVTPETHIGWLGSWIGQPALEEEIPAAFRRRMVARAAASLTSRSTAHGLVAYLELLGGGRAVVEDGGGIRRVTDEPEPEARPADAAPRVRMWVEDTGRILDDHRREPGQPLPEGVMLTRSTFEALVRAEIPAYVRAELWLGDVLLWSSDGDPSW